MRSAILGLTLASLVAPAVTTQAAPHFDAVSIKLSNRSFTVLPPVRSGHWRFNGTLSALIAYAYDLHCCDAAVSGGAAWVKTQAFAIDATTPGATAPDGMLRPMVEAMLVKRFHLASHAGARIAEVATLGLAPGGSKMKPATANCDPQGNLIAADITTLKCGLSEHLGETPTDVTIYGRSITMDALTLTLEQSVEPPDDRHPVVDRTGLAGKFDFDVHLTMLNSPSGGSPGADPDTERANLLGLEKALEEQCGLKLDLFRIVKLPIPARVVDSAEMPEN